MKASAGARPRSRPRVGSAIPARLMQPLLALSEFPRFSGEPVRALALKAEALDLARTSGNHPRDHPDPRRHGVHPCLVSATSRPRIACWTRPGGPRRIPARRPARPCPYGRDAGRTRSRRGRHRHRRAVPRASWTAGGRRPSCCRIGSSNRTRFAPRPFMRRVATTRRLSLFRSWSATLPTSVSGWRWSTRSRVSPPSRARRDRIARRSPGRHGRPPASRGSAADLGAGRARGERSRPCGPTLVDERLRSSPRRGSRVVRWRRSRRPSTIPAARPVV